jgi:hypothetical protein
VELVYFFEAGEDGMARQADELVAAEVVGAAFHVADAQVAQERFEKGQVAEKELILQGFGAGGDDDPVAGAEGGKEVGEGFAGAGAGFDDQVALLCKGALDGLGHLELAGAVFVGQGGFGEDAAGGEEGVEGGEGSALDSIVDLDFGQSEGPLPGPRGLLS